jgi:hypothetical protein
MCKTNKNQKMKQIKCKKLVQFNSHESLQTFIFSVQFDHRSGIFVKVAIRHRNSIKIKEFPCVD